MKLWNHSDHIVFETRHRLPFPNENGIPSILGPRVNTVVINSLDKGNGLKCTDVSMGDCHHMRNMWDRRHNF